MDDSILNSIKKMVGIEQTDTAFDVDLIIGINSALSILTQIGAGPKEGFKISDSSATWSDFIGDRIDVDMIKMYVFVKVKPVFDPPQNSFVIDMYKKQEEELVFRINVAVDKETEDENNVSISAEPDDD